jgi:hypothetical protein
VVELRIQGVFFDGRGHFELSAFVLEHFPAVLNASILCEVCSRLELAVVIHNIVLVVIISFVIWVLPLIDEEASIGGETLAWRYSSTKSISGGVLDLLCICQRPAGSK